MTETSRDVLAELLAAMEGYARGTLGADLPYYKFSSDRIRAAIAADDAELARLRCIEDAARIFVESREEASRKGAETTRSRVDYVQLRGVLRQPDAAQRIAGEGGDSDG